MTTTSDNSYSIALPAKHVPGPRQGQWTYNDYAALPDDGPRYEVMNGVLVMIPVPEADHQSAVVRLSYYLLQVVEFAGLGRVFPGPLDVCLTPERVVQPDVLVVLNANFHKIEKKYVLGSPDLTIEVASLGTEIYDRLNKCAAYEQAGISEYWIAYLQEKMIEVLVLEEGGYQSLGTFKEKDTLPSRVVPGIANVAVEQFFFAG